MIAEAFAEPAQEALGQFGVTAASVTLAARAENVTFKVVATDGGAWTLRFHRPGYHAIDELEAEQLWTSALAEAGLAVPAARATPDGRHFVEVAIPVLGERRWVGMARWLEGEVLLPILHDPVADPPRVLGYFDRIGAMLATMHHQASGWTVPARFQRRVLDADGLAGLSPYWGRFWDQPHLSAEERELLARVRAELYRLLGAYGRDSARFSVIHADLHPGNILVNGEDVAAIDFDDAAFGWHMFDLAVALHQCQELVLFPEIYRACLAGYVRTRPTPEADLRMVPVFLLMRGLAEISWFADRPEITTPEEQRAMIDFVVAQARAFEAGELVDATDSLRTLRLA